MTGRAALLGPADIRSLAAELGISRATLFRRVGNRDAILGHALAHLGARTLVRIQREHDRAAVDQEGDPEAQERQERAQHRADDIAQQERRPVQRRRPPARLGRGEPHHQAHR